MKKSQLILVLLIIIAVIFYFYSQSFQDALSIVTNATKSMNIEAVVEYIRSFGVYAWVISFALMVATAVIAPLPAFLITLSNAVIFGFAKGAFLSWSSAMVGALLCFYIARILGKEVAEKFVGKKLLKTSDEYFQRYGKHTILVCRLLPFVSFDLISYAAGLTSMKFWGFFVATGLGQLPATLIYSYFGQNLSKGGKILFFSLSALFALSIIIYIFRKTYERKKS